MKAQTDSVYMKIDSSSVVSYRNTSQLSGGLSSSMKMDLVKLKKMPSLLGTADPLQYVKLFPGVSTTSEIDSGIRIQGCETEHNDISIDGVPVYGATHLLGLFSVFNPNHFEGMKYSTKTAPNLSRLGGSIAMTLPAKLPQGTSGSVNLGIIASDGSVASRIGEKSALFASVRGSYIYPVYKGLLTFDNRSLIYNFSDLNLTYLYKDNRDMVRFNYYGGRDDLRLEKGGTDIGLNIDWGNGSADLKWRRLFDNDCRLEQDAWWSLYLNRPTVITDSNAHYLASHVNSAGYSGKFSGDSYHAGVDVRWYDCRPQNYTQQRAVETVINGSKRFDVKMFSATLALAGHLWWCNETGVKFAASPQVDCSYNFGAWGRLHADAGMNNQFLFQTGISNIGFPCNFYFLAGKLTDPQRSIFAELSYDNSFLGGMYELSAQAFYRKLYNQVEYQATVYDYLYSAPELPSCLRIGDGYCYGLALMLSKKAGAFTGWIGYTLSRSMRRFPEYYGDVYFPSMHDRTHELNVVANYDYRKWTFSGVMVAATGTPFTAPDYIYLTSGLLISHYAPHNSNRLNPYFKLDVAASRNLLASDHVDIDMTLSINNVTYTKNDLIHTMKYSHATGEYYYGKYTFDFALIPSVSLQLKFK